MSVHEKCLTPTLIVLQELPPETPFEPLGPNDDHEMGDISPPSTTAAFTFGTNHKVTKPSFNVLRKKRSAPSGPEWDHQGPFVIGDAAHGSSDQSTASSATQIFTSTPSVFTAPIFANMPGISTDVPGPSNDQQSQKELHDLRIDHTVACDQVLFLKDMVKGYFEKNSSLGAEVEDLKAQLKCQKADAEQAKGRNDFLSKLVISNKDDDLSKKDKKIQRKDKEIQEKDRVIDGQNKEIGMQREEIRKRDRQIEGKNEDTIDKDIQIRELNDDYAAAHGEIDDRDQTIMARDDEIEALRKELVTVRQAQEEVQAKAQAKDQDILKLQKDVIEANAQHNKKVNIAKRELDKTIEDNDKEISNRDKAITKLQTQCNAVSNALETLKMEGRTYLEDQDKEHRAQLGAKDQEVARLKAQCNDFSIRSEVMKAERNDLLEARDKEHQTNLEIKDQENSQFQARVDNLLKQLEEWRTNWDKYVRKADEEYQKQIKAVKAGTNEVLQKRDDQHQKQVEDCVRKCKEQIEVSRQEHDNDFYNKIKDAQEIVLKREEERETELQAKSKEIFRTAEGELRARDERIKELEAREAQEISWRNRQIERLQIQVADLDKVCEGYCGENEVKDTEISKLTREVQVVEGQGREKKIYLERKIKHKDQIIAKKETATGELENKVQDLTSQIEAYQKKEAEVEFLDVKETGVQDTLSGIKARLEARYEKQLEQLQDMQKHADKKSAEYVARMDEEFTNLEGGKSGLEADVQSLIERVGELLTLQDDLRREVDANTKKVSQSHVEKKMKPSNELARSSHPLSSAPNFDSKWNSSSDDESEDAMARRSPVRRRHYAPYRLYDPPCLIKNSSTQTDDWPGMPTPTLPIEAKAHRNTMEMGTQTEIESKPDAADKAAEIVQVDAELDSTEMAMKIVQVDSKGDTAEKAAQTIPVYIPAAVAVTSPTASPEISLGRRPLYWFLILLVMAIIILGVLYGESARRERTMWLKANDYTRRAVISLREGGGTGTKVPAWLWKEPLLDLSNRYY
ncbi:MAG: hypothetical protein Q9170_000199 [Blastenia crenularia]